VGLPLFFSLGLLFSPIVDQAVVSKQSQTSFDKSFHYAVSLHSQGELELAFRALTKALAISRQERATYKEGRCLLRLGILSWDIGNMPDSSSYFNAAKTAFDRIGDRLSHEFCARCLEIARLYKKGKVDRDANLNYSSLQSFEQAIRLGRELGLPGFELKCLRQKGLTYWQLGEFNLYLACNQRGLEIADSINHKIEKGRCLNNIGVYYQKQNEYSLSLAFFERALSFLKKVDDQTTEAECLSNIGVLYRDLGNYPKALNYLSDALELDKTAGEVSSVSADLDNIGSTYLRRGLDSNNEQDLLRALDVFYSCLSLRDIEKTSPIIRFSALNNIGIIKCELTEHLKAREYFSRALDFATKGNFILEKCNILNNIATSYFNEKRIDLAMEYYLKALEIGSANTIENAVMESCLGLGQCYEAAKEPSNALLFYKRSIEVMEQVRGRISSEYFKIGFARNKMNAYQRVLKILSDAYFDTPTMTLLEEIYQFIEKAKARAFFEGISEARANRKPEIKLSLKEKEQVISQKIDELSHKLTSLNLTEREREKMNMELEGEEEKYFRLISEIRTDASSAGSGTQRNAFNISQVRSQLIDDHTGLLEYFLGDDRSYLVYVSRKTARLYKLTKRNEITDSLRAYIKMLESNSRNNAVGFAAAKRIAGEIFPLAGEREIKGLKAIIIIPDGILHYLPFETLPAINKGDGAYLIEDLAMSYCQSVSSLFVLKRPREQSVPRKELLALGAPINGYEGGQIENNDYTIKIALRQQYYDEGYKFSPLPFSKKEVSEIGKLFPRTKRNILIGKDASEGAIKSLPLDIYRLIHFACHGFLDEKYPFRSSLVLTPSDQQGEDGFLQMREIYNLKINADLVVLSACQTGNGFLERAEGPIGLTRPFFYAGARSVISSLWPINDKATVSFMKEFYGFLVQGHSTAKALQLTKKRMLRSAWSRPFYWASFILSGDPAAVSFGK
jgi:CHAT domain-containing protein/Tfp pilus assembly protein PilF